uniref:Protein kinase domain-containing protein n=1 Tax=Globodera pallida TaxID=36090 RepID=A0A183BW10_GLOPA
MSSVNLGPGMNIANLQVVRCLGSGSYGDVYLCQNSDADEFAVKIEEIGKTQLDVEMQFTHCMILALCIATKNGKHGDRTVSVVGYIFLTLAMRTIPLLSAFLRCLMAEAANGRSIGQQTVRSAILDVHGWGDGTPTATASASVSKAMVAMYDECRDACRLRTRRSFPPRVVYYYRNPY